MQVRHGVVQRPPVEAAAPAAGPASGSSRSSRWFLPSVLCLAAVVAGYRAWPRVAAPSLWGEDGPVYLAGAREDGLAAVLEPYVGYLHAIPRLLAWALEPLPLTWQPGWYAAVGVVAGFGFAAPALSQRLAWLLPARSQRAALLMLLVLAPARNEVTGNLANLIFLGSVALLLLALADDPATPAGRVAEVAGVALLAFSGPLALMVLPVFAARLARLRSRHSLAVGLVVLGGSVVQWALLLTGPRTGGRTGTVGGTVTYVWHRLLPAWLVGDGGVTAAWEEHPRLLTAGCVLLVVALGAALWHLPHRPTAIALVLAGAVAVAVPAGAYGRMWLPPVAQRHLVLPLALMAVVLVAAVRHRRTAVRWVVAGTLAVAAIGMAGDFALTRWPEQPLGPMADCLDQGREPCPVPVNPPGWRPRHTGR